MKADQGGTLKIELVLGIMAALGAPVTAGLWVGSIQRQVNTQEARLEKAEALPLTVVRLETELAIVKEEVRATRVDIRELTKEIREANQ